MKTWNAILAPITLILGTCFLFLHDYIQGMLKNYSLSGINKYLAIIVIV